MAWFNPADLSDLNNEVEKGGGDSGANGENGANGSGAWFNPADLQVFGLCCFGSITSILIFFFLAAPG